MCHLYYFFFLSFLSYLFMCRLMSVSSLARFVSVRRRILDSKPIRQMRRVVSHFAKHQKINMDTNWETTGGQKNTLHPILCIFFFSSYVCNTVSPMIFVPNQLVGAPSGTDVAIDCNTEAHPKYIKNPFLYKILFLFLHAIFMI